MMHLRQFLLRLVEILLALCRHVCHLLYLCVHFLNSVDVLLDLLQNVLLGLPLVLNEQVFEINQPLFALLQAEANLFNFILDIIDIVPAHGGQFPRRFKVLHGLRQLASKLFSGAHELRLELLEF